MGAKAVALDHVRVLNVCAKYLARDSGQCREPWHFPLVDHVFPQGENKNHNCVTFVCRQPTTSNAQIFIAGSFAPLYQRYALQPIIFNQQSTCFHAASFVIPFGQRHRYRFFIDGEWLADPINPQTQTLDNGEVWSQFFTDYCYLPIHFNEAQRQLLQRLTQHLLPFSTQAGRRFLDRHYQALDDSKKRRQDEKVFQLDSSVGEVNYIDKLLAREESHLLPLYRQGLKHIDRALRQRNPYEQPHLLSKPFFLDIYQDMVDNHVDGWPQDSDIQPRAFLQTLRRHTIMATFSHPKHGGNISAAGWELLRDHFSSEDFDAFNWPAALETPLGNNRDYLG